MMDYSDRKLARMKLEKNTILLILVTIVLTSWVYIFEIRSEQQKQVITQQQKIFNLNSKNLKKILVQKSDTTLEFIATDGSWQMTQPEKLRVNSGVMAFLLNLIAEGKKERIINVSPTQLSQYGLESPFATITLELNNGQQQKVLLGKQTIDPNLIYARVIKNRHQLPTEIVILSKNWQYAIDRDLAEWKEGND